VRLLHHRGYGGVLPVAPVLDEDVEMGEDRVRVDE
jgi:hypothetical protein